MSKSIEQLFPKAETKKFRIQADIPASLFKRADSFRKERNMRWNEVVKRLLWKFVEDLNQVSQAVPDPQKPATIHPLSKPRNQQQEFFR